MNFPFFRGGNQAKIERLAGDRRAYNGNAQKRVGTNSRAAR